MRQLEYYSPTSLKTWKSDKREFYVRYLADTRPPRAKQTEPMAIGSAFDAYIKCYLAKCLWGSNAAKQRGFEFEKVFEEQVEEHNRDQARLHGSMVLDLIKNMDVLVTC